MIWMAIAVLACAALIYIGIKKIHKLNILIGSLCLDIFRLKQNLCEFEANNDYKRNELGKEVKACILSLQREILKNAPASPVKKIIEEKKTKEKRSRRDDTKKKQSEKMKAIWAEKKKEKAKALSSLNNQTATESEEVISDFK